MSSTYSSFAIYGASGNLGTHIVDGFLANGVQPVILTRKFGESKTFRAGSTVVQVDIARAEDVASALSKHNVEVLVSTVGSMAIPTQNTLIDAAKMAGVDLFVPSEFGTPSEGIEEGLQGLKDGVAEYAKSVGVHIARFFTGLFTERATWLVGFDANGKVNTVGETNVHFTLTSMKDIGGYVGHVLTTLSRDRLRNSVFRIQGDRSTLESLASLLKTEAVKVEKVPGEISELKTALQILIGKGIISTGWDHSLKKDVPEMAERDNELWPSHQWLSIQEVLKM